MANTMLPSGISVRIREDLIDGISRVQTTLVVDPIITKGGHRVTMADIGTIGYGKINGGTSKEELISWTGITDNVNTFTLTGCTWGINFHNLSSDVANRKRHTSGNKFEIKTDMHYITNQFRDNADNIFTNEDDMEFKASEIKLGNGTNAADKKLTFANGDTNTPYIKYDETLNKVLISNDGVNSYDPQAGGSGVTGGLGININAGSVDIDKTDATIIKNASAGDADAAKLPLTNANGVLDSSFVIDTAADTGLEEGADGGTKVKAGNAIDIDANGVNVNTDDVYTAINKFKSVVSTGIAAEVIATGKLYRIPSSTTTSVINTTSNGSGTPFDWDGIINIFQAFPLDKTSGYHKINSTTAVFGTVTSGGVVSAKIYKLAGAWNNSDTATTMAGAVLLATSSQTISTTGTKTFTFSTPPIVDFNRYKYAIVFEISGSYSNVTFCDGSKFNSSSGNGYKGFHSFDSGSTWGLDDGYIGDLEFTMDNEIVGGIYLGTATTSIGIVTSGGNTSDEVSLQSAGFCDLSGVVAGKMYYADSAGTTTDTADGTKLSIGLGVDTNKILIIKGIK